MKGKSVITVFILSIWVTGCATLNPRLKSPTVIRNGSLDNYKYLLVSKTNSLTSGSGFSHGGQYYSSNKTVNPADVIIGILSKEGYIIVTELKEEIIDHILIVNYGESGRRNTGLGGYTIEVTIQFVSAKSQTLLSACTAEGQGETEADDIRHAITRCLTSLLSKAK